MAATRRRRARRARPALRRIPWIAAGLAALAAGEARAQSNLDFNYLYYQESNGRTKVLNPSVLFHQDFGLKGGTFDLLLGYDTISGASPTGGYPTLDTTTSASGTTTSSGNFPQVSYKDSRKAGTVTYAHKFGSNLPSIDVSYSKENDYLARGAGLADAITLFGGRGTLHLAVSASRDVVTPVTTLVPNDKSSDGFAAGWTWIIGERDLFDVSASVTKLRGYLDDPYKIVPVGAGTVAEHRPDSRARYATLFKYGHFFDVAGGALKGTYRFYGDDWGIRAHTVELFYDQHVSDSWIVSPQVRLYTQNGASFYASSFAAPLTYMSADYRLSPFDSYLFGLSAGYTIKPGLVLAFGGTYTSQRGRDRVVPSTPILPPAAVAADDGEGASSGTPLVSSADMTVITWTVGLSWRY